MRLEERFKAFLSTIHGVESLDDCEVGRDWPVGKQKADYLFEGGRIICELKRLTSDPLPKLDAIVETLKEREDWPIICGSRSLSSVLKRLKDEADINNLIRHRISNAVEVAIRDANGQIRDTRDVLDLTSAEGVLVLLNEDIHLHSPQLVIHRIGKALTKTREQEPRFRFISAVLVIDVAHVTIEGENHFAFPIMACQNPLSGSQHAVPFVDDLMARWTEFEGIRGVRTDWGNLDHKFINARELRP